MKLSDIKPLHAAGWWLLWLHPREKRPIGNNWTHLPRHSWGALETTYEQGNNIGVRLGQEISPGRYLACIDVDIKHESHRKTAVKKLKELLNALQTQNQNTAPNKRKMLEVRSGSGNGSRHLYFTSDKPFKQIEIEKKKGEWEIVIYSKGRQTVLPPSVHPNGLCYVWRGGVQPEAGHELPLFSFKQIEGARSSVQEGGKATRIDAGDPENNDRLSTAFRAEEVSLDALPLATIRAVEECYGVDDRSASLMSVAMSMCTRGFTDNQILSVLSDERNELAKTAYDHAQTKDRARAVQWLRRYTLEKARYETHIMRRFENPPRPSPRLTPDETEVEKQKAKEDSIREGSFPDINQKDGKPRTTLRNIVHYLDSYSAKDASPAIGFDEFANRDYFLRDTACGGQKGEEVGDHNCLMLKHHLATHYRFEPSKELCHEAYALVSRQNAFHPVRDYLAALSWDGVPRLNTWLSGAFGATGPQSYLEAVSRKVLIGAVKRVMEPGCKWDYILVLESYQGPGKSKTLRALAGHNWFSDPDIDIRNKDAIDQITGKWIIELSELTSVMKSENNARKSFITRQVDRVRLSYERRAKDFPRQSIFIGTTNEQEYLNDPSGSRRYWPVSVSKVDDAWVAENRDQLWAEAYCYYQLGENVWLSDELETTARKEQDARYQTDEWEAEIAKYLKKDVGGAHHTVTEVWRAITDLVTSIKSHPPMQDAKRIGSIMHRLGYVKKVKRLDGVNTKVWVKP